MATQVRMEVSKTVNAKVHYIAKSLDVKVSYVYEMITVAYLVDHDLEDAVVRLKYYTDLPLKTLPPDLALPQPEDD
jgi:hypothetical protein